MLQNNANANVAAKLYATKTWPNDSEIVRGQRLAQGRQSATPATKTTATTTTITSTATSTPMSMTVCAFYAHSHIILFAAK